MPKSKVPIFFGALIIFAASYGVGLRLHYTKTRPKLAAEMSSENIRVTTGGTFNETMYLTLVDDNQVRCNLTVGEILDDAHLRGELAEDGFTEISCGTLKVGIVR
jgi:hypothetical protein